MLASLSSQLVGMFICSSVSFSIIAQAIFDLPNEQDGTRITVGTKLVKYQGFDVPDGNVITRVPSTERGCVSKLMNHV